MASFDDDIWPYYTAISEIYFADQWAQTDNQELQNAVIDALRASSKGGQTKSSLPAAIRERVEALKVHLPSDFEITSIKASPIYWVRFANCLRTLNRIRVSGKFFANFGEWRCAAEAQRGPITMCSGTGAKRSKITLDQYLLDPNISSPEEWVAKSLAPAAANLPPQSTRKKARSIEEIVGVRIYRAVRDCVEKAANGKVKIPNFTGEKLPGEGRYFFPGTRPRFAKELKKRFSDELPGSINTITQALSDFVGCNGYSSKKRGALKRPTKAKLS